MKSVRFTPLLVFLIIFSLSCAFVTQSISGGGGPKGFTAETTPYGSVKLSWDAVEGAQGYLLETQLEGMDLFITVAELNADQTSYEDYLAPEESTLTYRVQATTDGEAGEYSTVSVTTVAVQPNPLTVEATFAEDQVVTQSIGAEGGSMSLTDQNGVIYELLVPPGAVLDATDFTLTPVTDIQGWPLDGTNLGSVRIGPESLDLYAYPTLTITLPEGLPQDDTIPVGYGFEGSGEEFHLQLITIEAAETSALPNGGGIQAMPISFQRKVIVIKQPVKKGGSQGVGTGTKDGITNLAQQHPPTDAGVNFAQKQVAQQAVDDDLAPLPTRSSIMKNNTIMRELGNDLVPRVSQSKTCDDVRVLIKHTRAWYVTAQNSPGLDHTRYDEPLNYIIENTKIKELINNGAKACKENPKTKPSGYDCLRALLSDIENPIGGKNDLFYNGGLGETQLTTQEITSANEALDECKDKFAYQADFPGVTSNSVCDFTKPFILRAENAGATLLYKFNSGTFQLETTYPECTLKGSGTYTLPPVTKETKQVIMNLSVTGISVACSGYGQGLGGTTFQIVWKRTDEVCGAYK